MLNGFTKVAFLATSIVPHLVVYALVLGRHSREDAMWVLLVALLSFAFAPLLLALARRQVARETLSIERAENIDRDGFAFLLSYAIPLLGAQGSAYPHAALGAALLFMIAFLLRSEMLWVNPLLVTLGYHHLKVVATSNSTYLLLTRRNRQAGERNVIAVRLTDILWLEE